MMFTGELKELALVAIGALILIYGLFFADKGGGGKGNNSNNSSRNNNNNNTNGT